MRPDCQLTTPSSRRIAAHGPILSARDSWLSKIVAPMIGLPVVIRALDRTVVDHDAALIVGGRGLHARHERHRCRQKQPKHKHSPARLRLIPAFSLERSPKDGALHRPLVDSETEAYQHNADN